MNQLTGRVALVTGGSRGIGAATALRLAGEGADVAITYVQSQDKAQAVAEKIRSLGRRAVAIHADSAEPAAVVDAVEATVRDLGGLDILVNNAGIYTGGALHETTVEEIDRILAVNVRAVFLTSQAAAAHLPDGGRIITIGSALTSRVPAEGMTLYAMAKSALTGLTKGLARDLGPRNIAVTLISGGLIDTDMNPADGPAAPFFTAFPALGRYGTADDIASTVAHLAGIGGQYITGADIRVDGGFAA